jgi:ribose 5-phosphate isomerase B
MLYIASDHAGFQLKKFLVDQCKKVLKVPMKDLGPKEYKLDDDFPDFAIPVSRLVGKNKKDRGILICGSGHGMCITANKIKGVRAILGSSIEGTEMGRREEDANVLCLSARVLSHEHAVAIVKRFLETTFDDQDKRIRRLKKISKLE